MSSSNKGIDRNSRKYLEQFIRQGADLHQLEQIKKVFDAFDLQQTGFVNPRDIKNALKEQGQSALSNPLYQTFCDLDQEGGGKISFQDFVFYLTPNVNGSESFEEVKKIFSLFDDEKSGYITLGGLRRLSKFFNMQLEQTDIAQMIKQADLDQDSRVSCEQFYSILTYRSHLL